MYTYGKFFMQQGICFWALEFGERLERLLVIETLAPAAIIDRETGDFKVLVLAVSLMIKYGFI